MTPLRVLTPWPRSAPWKPTRRPGPSTGPWSPNWASARSPRTAATSPTRRPRSPRRPSTSSPGRCCPPHSAVLLGLPQVTAIALDPGDLVLTGDLLTGTCRPVLGADGHVLLRADDSWCTVQHPITPLTPLDFSRPLGRLVLDKAPVTRHDLDSTAVEHLAATLFAAEAAGVARWCLDTAVAYAKIREQFDRPIGSFQAVKHLCAEMLCRAEQAAALAWDAATRTRVAVRRPPPRPSRSTPRSTTPRTASRSWAASASRGSTTRTCTCAARSRTASCWAAAPAGAAGSPDSRWPVRDAGSVWRPRTRKPAPRRGSSRTSIAELSTAEQRERLADSGYLAPHWPRPYGLAASPRAQLVIDEELAKAGVRRPDLVIGAWAVPTILTHGTDEQQKRFVPPTLRGELRWCQLFSEPGAGSDLAALRTKAAARRRGMAAVRPEGVDLRGRRGGLGHLPRPHRPDRAETRRHHVLPGGHALAGHHAAAAAGDHRRGTLQRGVPRRRVRAGRLRGRRGERRLAAGPHDARQRAGRARRAAPRSAKASNACWRSPRPASSTTVPANALGSWWHKGFRCPLWTCGRRCGSWTVAGRGRSRACASSSVSGSGRTSPRRPSTCSGRPARPSTTPRPRRCTSCSSPAASASPVAPRRCCCNLVGERILGLPREKS